MSVREGPRCAVLVPLEDGRREVRVQGGVLREQCHVEREGGVVRARLTGDAEVELFVRREVQHERRDGARGGVEQRERGGRRGRREHNDHERRRRGVQHRHARNEGLARGKALRESE